MAPNPPKPLPEETQASPSTGWNLHILSPEESERLLRDEPRIPGDIVMAELNRLFGAEQDGE